MDTARWAPAWRRWLGPAATGAMLLTVGMVAAACGSSSSSSTTTTKATSSSASSSSNATVRTASVPGVGTVLVDSAGHTLYLFTSDKQSGSTCTGACAAAWPPLVASGTPTAGGGVRASLLGTVRDANGQTQVTYDHWPVYTFIGDTAPGEAHGQGNLTNGGYWWVLDTSGSPVHTAAKPATSSSTSTTKASSGYGY